MTMPDPPADVWNRAVPVDAYQVGQRVWVYRNSAWRPGVVLTISSQALTVRYRPGQGRGTGVDTVTGASVAARTDADPVLDSGDDLGSVRR
jgi:hypothetical protein